MKRSEWRFALLLMLVFFASMPGLLARWGVESSNRETAIAAEFLDIEAVALESGLGVLQALDGLRAEGLTAVAVSELTGKELVEGRLPLEFGPGFEFFDDVTEISDRAVIRVKKDASFSEEIENYIRLRFPDAAFERNGKYLSVILPVSFQSTAEMGILPDFTGLESAKKAEVALIYRPSPSPGVPGEDVSKALEWILERYKPVGAVIPRGAVLPAYPDIEPLSRVLRDKKTPVAKVEFSRQIGSARLEKALFPLILPLHSVPDEEVIVRAISRDELVDRFVRAARERSVRILYIRPSPFFSGDRFEQMKRESRVITTRIEGLGLKKGWPSTYPLVRTGILSAFSLSLMTLLLMLKTITRFVDGKKRTITRRVLLYDLVLILVSGILTPVLLKVSLASRIFGALAASFGAAEATLVALDGNDRPIKRMLAGAGVAILAGLVIASFFGNTWYMLRMATFSGVKIALVFPPMVVLLHDLRRRIHPESLEQVLSRPPLWGEIVLFAFLFGMAGIVLLRSGNVSFVPGWEKTFRETLEQLLIARPRTKEFMAGYPCLVLWYITSRMGLWERYREVFRLGGTLAFSSVINSFCHFHTHLSFILLRVVNGFWAGALVGLLFSALILWVVLPAWRRWGRLLTS